MTTPQPLPWCDPLALAAGLGEGPMVLLHSSAQTDYSGQFSLLGYGLAQQREITHLRELDSLCTPPRGPYEQPWFGYLGYALRHSCERYTPGTPEKEALPPGLMMRFEQLYLFDHAAKTLLLWGNHPDMPPPQPSSPENPMPPVISLSSNMSRADYEARVTEIIERIHTGQLYQANFTRKFFGSWEAAPSGLSLFAKLCRVSPAPYSAYLRLPQAEILSSSPELFLKCDADGRLVSRPIKGTAPRGATHAADAAQREYLHHSPKNRSENLMITDLVRHDLSQSCRAGSVEAESLFDVTAHPSIFHMASVVRGQRAPNKTLADVLIGCFPPGSMTGAPKISAVELCTRLEGIERGVYSGAIGWIGGDGSAEFSVVIRTLILRGRHFEFQVGGGIVADSNPREEWQETVDKSLGILAMLDIPRAQLEAL